jgi:CheY-like chemotaxis protein
MFAVNAAATATVAHPVRVLVIDDSAVFLSAVRAVLGSMADFESVGEATTGEEGVALAMELRPDMVLVDIFLPGIDGLETCRRLRSRQPAPEIVLCSAEEDPRLPHPELPCSGSPFLKKSAITARALRELWSNRARPSGSGEHPTDTPARPIAQPMLAPDAPIWITTLSPSRARMEVEMSIGPVELLVLKFPGNKFTGGIIPELRSLVESGTIRIVDILFAITDDQGEVAVLELSELDPDVFGEFDPVITDQSDLLNHDDAKQLAKRIGPNSSAAVMLFENTWATRFRDAVLEADGELVLSERIPKDVVDAMVASAAA